MSEIAILTAVPTYLIDKLTDWTVDNCKAMPDGQPIPVAPNIFCAVHITEIQSKQESQGTHEEIWGFGITITKRITTVPYDRITPSIYLTQLSGISSLMERTKYALHNRWSLIQSINANIPNDPQLDEFVYVQTFSTPAMLLNRTPKLTFQEEDWFHGTHGTPERDNRDGYVGVTLTASFGNMLKITKLQEDTCE